MVNFKALTSSESAPMQTSTDYGSSRPSSFFKQKRYCLVKRLLFTEFLKILSVVVFKHYTATMIVVSKSTGIAK